MATITIDLPDQQAAALTAKAAAQGLTLEGFLRKLAEEEATLEGARSPQAAEASEAGPEGWTVHEYINHGRP